MVALLGSLVVIAVVVFGILSLAPKDSGVAPATVTEPLPPVVTTPETSGSAPTAPAQTAPKAQATTPATTPGTSPTTPSATATPAANSDQPKPDPKTTVAQAQQNAMNGLSQAAACFTDTQDYAKCRTAADLGNTGLAIASGTPAPGEVALTGSGTMYRVTAAAADGLLFTIRGTVGGAQEKTCTASGGTPCPSPTWG